MGWLNARINISWRLPGALCFPYYFWGEAILTATYLINRMSSRVLTFQSPRQLLLKKFPHTRAASSDLALKVFGCTTFVHVYPQNRSKFAPRANKCIFLGYSPTQKKGTNAILQPTKDFTPPWTSLSLNMSSSIPNLMFRGRA